MISKITPKTGSLTTAGLFAGIGGIELGLHRAGHSTQLLCEIMPEALRVLKTKEEFASAKIETDIRELADLETRQLNRRFPKVDLVAAGFPCQDLSQAGRTAGITGENSGLVNCLLGLLEKRRRDGPKWVLIENVPFMLQLDGGRAMSYLTEQIESLGYRWAYRLVDSRSFGLPHRRQRVVFLASKTDDPRSVLFPTSGTKVERERRWNTLCGFYWTEGNRGLGWAVDAVPTLKGGSTVGIPSPPAIWSPRTESVGTPTIRDAERLQGFPADWTLPAVDDPRKRNGPRWKLVGNAVTVNLGHWIGSRLLDPCDFDDSLATPGWEGRWPNAAYGHGGKVWTVHATEFPVAEEYRPLGGFLEDKLVPLSMRATRGFVGRFEKSPLRKPDGFLESLREYLRVRIEVENGEAVSA